jgi:hypothetical protein
MSPPEANAISLPSGEMDGVANEGLDVCAKPTAANTRVPTRDERKMRLTVHLIIRMMVVLVA